MPKERGPSQLYVAPVQAAPVAPASSNRRVIRIQAMPNEQRYIENRNLDLEKSRSLDSEYERYPYSDFAKSRSFDEDEQNTKKYLEDNRSFSIDHVYSKGGNQNMVGQRKPNSPPNYNSNSSNARLFDHELMYEIARSQRSPVIDNNYKLQQQKHGGSTRNSRKRSPNLNRDTSYRSMTRNLDQSKVYRDLSPSNVSTIVVNHSAIGSSGGHTSSGSDYDGIPNEYDYNYDSVRVKAINDELIKEAKLVTDFLYGNNKTKADTCLNLNNNQRRRETKPSNRSHAGTNVASSSSSAAAAAAVRYIRN